MTKYLNFLITIILAKMTFSITAHDADCSYFLSLSFHQPSSSLTTLTAIHGLDLAMSWNCELDTIQPHTSGATPRRKRNWHHLCCLLNFHHLNEETILWTQGALEFSLLNRPWHSSFHSWNLTKRKLPGTQSVHPNNKTTQKRITHITLKNVVWTG